MEPRVDLAARARVAIQAAIPARPEARPRQAAIHRPVARARYKGTSERKATHRCFCWDWRSCRWLAGVAPPRRTKSEPSRPVGLWRDDVRLHEVVGDGSFEERSNAVVATIMSRLDMLPRKLFTESAKARLALVRMPRFVRPPQSGDSYVALSVGRKFAFLAKRIRKRAICEYPVCFRDPRSES